METNVKNGGDVKVANTVKADKKAPQFVAGNPVNTVSKKAEEEKETKMIAGAGQVEQTPQAEATKKEIKAQLLEEKPAPNLEQTLRKIKDLGRLSNQRDKLIETIDTLDAFEVKQLDEAEETNINHFQGCKLTITDDAGNTFSTKNPFIIDQVAKNINSLCMDKLIEVEGQISLTL